MNFSTYRFTLDLQKHQSQMSIAVSRYDTAVRLCISLTDGGNPYIIEDGCIAVLWGKKSEGEQPIISHTCMIESNTRIVYDFNEATADEPGIVNCQIRLYKDGKEIITAPKFIIVVDELIVKDDDIDLEGGEFTEKELSSLRTLLTEESGRVTAENARVQAELKRVAAENDRVQAEIDRANAETELQKEVDGLKDDMSATGNQISELQEYVHNLQGYDESLTKMVNDKLDKTTEDNIIYGTTAEGKQTKLEYSTNVVADSIAQRSWDGQLYIAKNPNESPHCATSRHYVDGLVNPLKERVSDLESLTLTYPEYKTVAYNKSVPANVGKYALIKSIGGATKVGINGEIPFGLADETGITIDQLKGTYTFKIQPNAERQFLIGQFPANTHLFLEFSYTETGGQVSNVVICLADGDGNVKDGFIEANSAFFTDDTYTHLSLNFENYDLYEEGNVTEVTVTAKIKVGFLGFINAEVSKIESRGANLIPFPYVFANKVMDVGYRETVSGVTFEVLENGLISAKGTSTSTITYWLWRGNIPSGNYYIGSKFPSGGILIANYNDLNNGCGGVNVKFTHNGGIMGMYISIASGVTLNSVFSPMITKDYYVSEFKPYSAEPIDTFTIPVEAIKALVDENGKPKVVDFGKGIDTTDYNYIECIDGKWYNWQKCKELVLNGTENWWLQSVNTHGIANFACSISELSVGKAICSDRDYDNSTIATATKRAIHLAIETLYVRDDVIKTVSDWKTHLDNRCANGNPIRVIYKLATPKVSDITEAFTNGYKIQVQGGGSLVPVNDNELPVPTNIAYVTRKG